MLNSSDLSKKLRERGLDLEEVRTHAQIIALHLKNKQNFFFDIDQPCVEENSGVISLERCTLKKRFPTIRSSHFIPAGGASSRYLSCFSALWALLPDYEQKQKQEEIRSEISSLKKSLQPVLHRLPPLLKSLIVNPEQPLSSKLVGEILREIETPKALLPFDSTQLFLDRQVDFSRQIQRFSLLHIICPLGYKSHFKAHLESKLQNRSETTGNKKNSLRAAVQITEQDAFMSTIRFDLNGQPLLVDKDPVLVPAGHGMLSKVLSRVSGSTKSIECFDFKYSFIQNIDNIIDATEPVMLEIQKFLDVYEALLQTLERIRVLWMAGDQEKCDSASLEFIEILGKTLPSQFQGKPCEFMLEVIFSTPCVGLNHSEIGTLLQRPFNILGQVPNTDNNVGGLPLYINQNKSRRKICVEGPHISPEDSKKLKESKSAKFFNPVLVCAESSFDPNYYLQRGKDLAIVSLKPFRGGQSLHCEYVLYELLGNSYLANVIFLGVTQNLFRPHKTIL